MSLLEILKKTSLSLIIAMGCADALAAGSRVDLPVPDELHAPLTSQYSLFGVFPMDGYLFLFPGKSKFMIKMPFKPDANERDTRFGKFTDQVRIPLEGAAYPGDWRGGFMNGTRFIVWDASLLQLLILRSQDMKTIRSDTVPVDTFKPAADRMGDPTAVETRKARQRFRDASRKIFGSRYTGMTEIPAKWEKNDGRKFLVTTTVPGFSLLMMACQKDDDAACIISRQCFLEGAPKGVDKTIAGVGVFEESREVLIGNSAKNEIDVYSFKSCFDVVWKRSLRLPPRLPKLSNIHVDKDGRLWVVTDGQDSFTNSSLFYWERDVWKNH